MIKIINEVNFDKWEKDNNFGEGEEWVVHIPKECIKGATLLSYDEYEEYEDNILRIDCWWWLHSADDGYDSVLCVDPCGDVDGYYVNNTYNGVRPVLILNLQSSNINPNVGDKIEFGEHTFTILSNNLAICDDFIGKGCFRENYTAKDANDYEKSDVKKVVDDWFNKSYSKYEEE